MAPHVMETWTAIAVYCSTQKKGHDVDCLLECNQINISFGARSMATTQTTDAFHSQVAFVDSFPTAPTAMRVSKSLLSLFWALQ